jgi:hypothetical protein
MILQPGAMPVYVASCEPTMLATLEPWPLASFALALLVPVKSNE